MAFLNPFLLGFAALVSIPVIIHLLNRSRFRVVIWAAMEFLLRAIKQNQRRIQLRDIILMIIRCAALLMLVLALARPTVNAEGMGFLGGRAGSAALILLDNSMSMACSDGRETRFDAAKRIAREIVGRLEKGTWVGIILFSDEASLPLGDPSQSLDFVKQEVDKLKQSDGTTNVEAALLMAREIFEKRREFVAAGKELYLISDFQAAVWKDPGGRFAETLRALDAMAALRFVNAGEGRRENLAIRDLRTTDDFVTPDAPTTIVTEIRNYGDADAAAVPVNLIVRGKPVARATVDVPAGGTAVASFDYVFARSDSIFEVAAKVDDHRLPNDDTRYLAAEVFSDIRVLVADGKPGDDESRTEGFYISRSLNLVDPETEARVGPASAEVVPHYRLGDRNLSNYRVVILADVPEPANPAMLDRFVRAGGGLIVFPGDQVRSDIYNRKMLEGNMKLLPARIGGASGDEEKRESSIGLAVSGLEHPVMRFFDTPENRPLLAEAKFFKRYDLEPVADEGVSVVARFQDGKPFIVERRIGSGFVWLAAAPASAKWSNFPAQPAFPITVNRAVQYMAQGFMPPRNVHVGDRLAGFVPPEDQAVPLVLTEPAPRGGRRQIEAIPTADRRAMFEVPETPFAGFYRVRQDKLKGAEFVFAANPRCEKESDLTAVGAEYIRANLPGLEFIWMDRNGDVRALVEGGRGGTEIWWVPMFAVFLLLAIESALAAHWAPKA
ncbi:MAG: VWA domain-containing protein [Planctomycetota bacterium]|nr:VWA domain-containing protein [Planctomycetota bacterium]